MLKLHWPLLIANLRTTGLIWRGTVTCNQAFFFWMWRKCMVPGSMLTYIWRQDSKVFPASWILIGQFKFQALQPNACKDRVATIVSVRSFEHQCRSSCNWRKSKMLLLASFHVFSGHHSTEHTKWRFYTRLLKISVKHFDEYQLKFGEMHRRKTWRRVLFFIFYNMTISQLFPLDSFQFIFYCVIMKTIYKCKYFTQCTKEYCKLF